MNRVDTLRQIASFTILQPKYHSIAVLLSSLDEVTRFNNDLKQVFDTVPDWLKPILIQHTKRNFKFSNCRIDIVNCDTWLRSSTLSVIYKSSLLTEEKRKEYEQIELMHVLITGSTNTIIEFEDE